jgi:hypothetical protein
METLLKAFLLALLLLAGLISYAAIKDAQRNYSLTGYYFPDKPCK